MSKRQRVSEISVARNNCRVLLTGGGTAGHVYPALAVLEELQQHQPSVTAQWIGSERIESRIVPAAGVDFHPIDIRFSWRAPVPSNWGYYLRHILPLVGGRPFRQASRALEAFRPDLVLATGGYVAAPVLWAAIKQDIPISLIEMNTPPGMVNWFFADRAWRIYAATAQIAENFSGRCALNKVRICGYPAQRAARDRGQVCRDLGLDPHRRILTVMGGSLGAGALHRALAELLETLGRSQESRWSQLAVLNVGGERPELMQAAALNGKPRAGAVEYRSVGYLSDAAGALHASDFYFGRSGAATVGELVAAGIPALLVPDPQHVDRQQYHNARALVARGQGEVLEQAQLSGARIMEWLGRVWHAPRLSSPQPAPAARIAHDLLSRWED